MIKWAKKLFTEVIQIKSYESLKEMLSQDANTFDKYLAEYLFTGGGLAYASSIVFDGELKGMNMTVWEEE